MSKKGIWAAFHKKTGELFLANTRKADLLADMDGDKRYRIVWLKEPKKQPKRVVLGVGHPFFAKWPSDKEVGYQRVGLLEDDCRGNVLRVRLKIGKLNSLNKIRLVAEVIK